jgi:hypothetical protein
MGTSIDRSILIEAARSAWVCELQAILSLQAGSPEWERQWEIARRQEEQYEAAKRELLRQRTQD